MKKIKLLSTLSSLGVLTLTAPLFVTSCSDNKPQYSSDFNIVVPYLNCNTWITQPGQGTKCELYYLGEKYNDPLVWSVNANGTQLEDKISFPDYQIGSETYNDILYIRKISDDEDFTKESKVTITASTREGQTQLFSKTLKIRPAKKFILWFKGGLSNETLTQLIPNSSSNKSSLEIVKTIVGIMPTPLSWNVFYDTDLFGENAFSIQQIGETWYFTVNDNIQLDDSPKDGNILIQLNADDMGEKVTFFFPCKVRVAKVGINFAKNSQSAGQIWGNIFAMKKIAPANDQSVDLSALPSTVAVKQWGVDTESELVSIDDNKITMKGSFFESTNQLTVNVELTMKDGKIITMPLQFWSYEEPLK